MRIVINCLAVLLLLVALLSLALPVATFRALLTQPDSSKFMLLFAVPALVFSVMVGIVVFRHFRRRDVSSAKTIVTASCFLLWVTLNTVSANTSRSVDPDKLGLMLFYFLAPIFVAVLLNKLLQKRVDRAYASAPTNNA